MNRIKCIVSYDGSKFHGFQVQNQFRTVQGEIQKAIKNICKDENIVIHGKQIKSDIDHQVVVVNQEGKVLAVYGPNGQGYLKSIRGLF